MTLRRALTLVALAAVTVTGSAVADGGPAPGFAGGQGVTGPGGKLRYVALTTRSGTMLQTVRVVDGRVLRWTEIHGRFLGIPLVTYSGTAGGLSRDLKTLVLTSHGNGTVATRFTVVDTRTLQPRQVITLRGAYSYDALSPDASMLYLIQYTSTQNVNHYRVRAYDLAAGRLLPAPIVDRREPGEVMSGQPLLRATTPDGRSVYTLYGRPEGGAFVHALDTVHRSARCIDLPWDGVGALGQPGLGLRLEGGRLVVTQRRDVLATVDTRTLRVRSYRLPLDPTAIVSTR